MSATARQRESNRSEQSESSEFKPNYLQKCILQALSKGPMTSGQLRAKLDCAESTFYMQLGPLKEADRVIVAKVGRESHYALPEHGAELYASTRKQSALERHVINNALRLVDEILQIKGGEEELYTVLYHCQLLYMGALALRAMHPKIPTFGTGPETNVGAELGQWYPPRRVVVARGGEETKAGAELGQWYRYWIEVLRVLGVF